MFLGRGRAAAALLALVLLAGCSGGDEPIDGGNGDNGAAEGDNGEDREATPVATVAEIDTVVGRLGTRKQQVLLEEITEIVDHWWDAGFVEGDYPRTDVGGAFRDFTRPTARAARKDRAMSNALIGDRLEEVEAVRRRLRIDVFAVGNEPAGATARIQMRINLSGEIERTDRVAGRLLLTPTRDGWVVFGYDVRRERVKAD